MPDANLRPRIQKNIETPDLPQVTLARLIEGIPGNYHLTYDDADSDNIAFELLREDETIEVSGLIRRWQGTQSRIELDGKVDVPFQVSLTRKIILGLIIIVPTIAGVWTFIVPWLWYLFGFVDAPPNPGIVNHPRVAGIVHMFYILLNMTLFIGLTGYVAKAMLFTDNNAKKRWQRKQELGQHLTALEALADGAGESDISRLSDKHHLQDEDVLTEQTTSPHSEFQEGL